MFAVNSKNELTRTYEVCCLPFLIHLLLLTSQQDALSLLESRRRRARPRTNPSVQAEKSPANVTPTVRGIPCLHGMSEWLQTLGHSVGSQLLSERMGLLTRYRTAIYLV